MVVHLPKVIGEMSREMHQILAIVHCLSGYQLRKVGGAVGRPRATQGRPDGHSGGLDLPEQLRTEHVSPGKLRRTIPDVAGASQARADVVLKISRQVEHQRASDILDAGPGGPKIRVSGIGFDLACQRTEITIEDSGDGSECHHGTRWSWR